jgi:hypothetical protein
MAPKPSQASAGVGGGGGGGRVGPVKGRGGRRVKTLGGFVPYVGTPYVAGEGKLVAVEREDAHQQSMRDSIERGKRRLADHPRPISPPVKVFLIRQCARCSRRIETGEMMVKGRFTDGYVNWIHVTCAVPPPSAKSPVPRPSPKTAEVSVPVSKVHVPQRGGEPERVVMGLEATWRSLRAYPRVGATVGREGVEPPTSTVGSWCGVKGSWPDAMTKLLSVKRLPNRPPSPRRGA